ncbi:Ni/Fe-hydrogenase 1 b-type cytochrome subunit [Sphingomonas piscis]|uniref:Ni/Fe-hydrogenase 1 b-type cytochrome subunit n=1 Tax=Sphingomonas piscis TaxID=2714943 RepID=A0A6G7YNB1_9SPHN|nr:cytochrome b/b6 domain-containing protein [Sphingomonas piscis]QIK78224.1 Ni/Fe-hydrogenase 1 b-type cytochrome subunit [Sphingomonas piscis]
MSASKNAINAAADGALAIPVWDLPIRLFHWSLVGLIGFSWWSAENDRIDLHIWSGIAVLTLLIFRFLWGLAGSSTARFGSFVKGPAVLATYLRSPRSWSAVGHTPLGAISVLALLSLLAIQVGLGLVIADEDGLYAGPLANLVSFDTSESAREWHEGLFNVLMALIAMHVIAVVSYRLFWKKKLTSAMLTGRTIAPAGTSPMRPGKWWVALICLAISIGIARWVIAGAPPFGG